MDKPQSPAPPRIVPAGMAATRLPTPTVDRPIVLAQITELTGLNAAAGDSWRDGVEMAVVEINAAGGLLGRRLELFTYDSQSTPAGARASAQRALDAEPLALLGPVASLTALAIAPMLRDRRTLLITGAESAALTAPPNPFVLLAGPGQAMRLARLASWARDGLRARRIGVLWSNAEPQRDIRDGFAAACRRAGLEIAADAAIPAGLAPAALAAACGTEIARLLQARPDAVFLCANSDQGGRMLTELRARAAALPVFGEASLLAPRILDQAGPAAIGLRVHVPVTADAPLAALEDFRDRFLARFKEPPDVPATKAYIAVAMVKAAAETLGRADPQALAEMLRGRSLSARAHPGLLLDTSWTAAGEASRVTFMAELREGRSLAWSALPPEG